MAVLSHVGVYVTDLEATKEFFERFFGGVSNSLYRNSQSGFSSYFLSFEDGTVLEIMHLPEAVKDDDGISEKIGFHHICFSLGDKASVDKKAEMLSKNGFAIKKGPRLTGDGHYECVISVFDEMLIEICDK